jgi:co-chaperonin GroES (HSP10)
VGTEHSISSPSEIELIDDRILVRYIKPKDKTDAGIFLPEDTVKQKEEAVQAGEVVAVGPGRFNAQGDREAMMDIRSGDLVFFAKFMGWQLLIPDETGKEIDYRVFGQHDLLGIKKIVPREEV